jgi:hypothetical protein
MTDNQIDMADCSNRAVNPDKVFGTHRTPVLSFLLTGSGEPLGRRMEFPRRSTSEKITASHVIAISETGVDA